MRQTKDANGLRCVGRLFLGVVGYLGGMAIACTATVAIQENNDLRKRRQTQFEFRGCLTKWLPCQIDLFTSSPCAVAQSGGRHTECACYFCETSRRMYLSIDDALAQYPRETFLRTPTPLDHLEHLSDQWGVDVFLKRDDLTDLALGGDKPRKLEYECAIAREQRATILVTVGGVQSNHARLTTAAARRMGIESAVVLSREREPELQGNLLTVVLMGARVQFVDTSDHWDLDQHARALCDELTAAGHRPYYIPVSGTTPRSCLGYVRAGLELADQIRDRQLEFDAVYLPFGTGGIFTATLFALRERGIGCPLIGVSVNRERAECLANVDRWWSALLSLLPRDIEPRREPFELYDEFVGRHYGDPTEASLDAIMLLGRTEGVLLDPVYSGKTAAALIAHQAAGRWGPRQQVLMLHSGGVPALFAYHKEIEAHLARRAGSRDAIYGPEIE